MPRNTYHTGTSAPAITAFEPEKAFELKLRSNSLPDAETALIHRVLNEKSADFLSR